MTAVNARWRGGAVAVAQVRTWTFAGTWLVGETVTVAIGSKTLTYTLTSVTIATFLPLLAAVYNAVTSSAYPEYAEMTAGNTSTTLTLTADTPGNSFTATISTNSASGTINSSSSSTGTATVANAGPNSWGTALNWDTGLVPVTGDTVTVDDPTYPIKHELDQSAVTLVALNIPACFEGDGLVKGGIGLPPVNTSNGTAYPEYRPQSLKIGATTKTIGDGPGNGSGMLNLDSSSIQTTLNAHGTGASTLANRKALNWVGTHAGNVVNHTKGSVGIATLYNQVATVATLNTGFQGAASSDVDLFCGPGLTLTTHNMVAGNVILNAGVTTVNKTSGVLTVQAGNITTLTQDGGTTVYNGSGTIGTATLGSGTVLDLSQDVRACTISTCNLYTGAVVLDPKGRLIAGGFAFTTVRCALPDVRVITGLNHTYTVS